MSEQVKNMNIGGIQKTSLLDYPEKISAIVFTKGCNFRCGYCHNPELFDTQGNQELKASDFLEFLKTRKGKLDAVVITGGEPCLQKDLKEFIIKIKNLGFLVKLDTNGSFPEVLENILPYIDYIAMDIKGPLEKYREISDSQIDTKKILKSIKLIMNSGIDHEFRTTVVKSQLQLEDFKKIAQMLKGAKKYYLQKFIPSKTLNPDFSKENTYTEKEFTEITKTIKNSFDDVKLRG